MHALCALCHRADPYREQSAPWFGVQKVARGGCFATPDLLLMGEKVIQSRTFRLVEEPPVA